jgi:hypothetical protein
VRPPHYPIDSGAAVDRTSSFLGFSWTDCVFAHRWPPRFVIITVPLWFIVGALLVLPVRWVLLHRGYRIPVSAGSVATIFARRLSDVRNAASRCGRPCPDKVCAWRKSLFFAGVEKYRGQVLARPEVARPRPTQAAARGEVGPYLESSAGQNAANAAGERRRPFAQLSLSCTAPDFRTPNRWLPSRPMGKASTKTARTLPPRSKVKPADTWDLASLFKSDAEWETAFAKWEKQIPGYEKFRGHLGDSAEMLAACMQFDSAVDRAGETLGVYASLKTTRTRATATTSG